MRRLSTSAAVAAAMLSAGAAAAQQNIFFATYVPPGEVAFRDGIVPFFDRIAAETGGKLTAQIFSAGQMLGPTEILQGVRDGVVQGGFTFESFYRAELPYTIMFNDTNGFNTDPVAAIGAGLETYFFGCPECLQEAENANVVMFGGHATAPYMIICAKNVNSIDDLIGARIRGTTPYHNAVINAVGGNGVNVSLPELSQALERGAIDCFFGPEAWITAFGIAEIVRYSVPQPHFGNLITVGFMTFNRDVYMGFPDEVKAAIRRNAPIYVAQATLGYQVEQAAAREVALAAGMREADLGAPYLARYEAFKQGELARITEAGKARGAANIEARLATYFANYEIWKGISAEIGTDEAKFVEVLNERIYSKLPF